MVTDSNSQHLDYKPSALAIELYSSICYCWEGVEFIQLVYFIIIYLSFLTVIEISSDKYSGLLDTGTPGTSREAHSEDANGETRTRNPWITNSVL